MSERVEELYGRWQALQLLSPVFELTKRAAPRAGFDHSRYDLGQLALRAIDQIVVAQASLVGSVSPERLTDHLRGVAQRMAPDDPTRPWQQVATTTLNTLLNDGNPHEATWVDLAGNGDEWAESRPYRFRLLRLVEGDEGTAIVATDQAILLYLRALNTDLGDQAMALKLLVEIQMTAGEFDKALRSAREATRTAQGLAATLRERLADTRRDVRSVDWAGQMPAWLAEQTAQVRAQLERDRQLSELAERSGLDPDATAACRKILEEVHRSWAVWARLERHLQQAIPVFLAAQQAQRFNARPVSIALDLVGQLLAPSLTAPEAVTAEVTADLVTAIFAPVVEPQWCLDGLVKALLRFAPVPDRPDPVAEEDELGEPDGDAIPDDIAAAAGECLGAALAAPKRLSELLAVARSRAGEVADPGLLCDVVWGASLWTFVADADAGDAEEGGTPSTMLADVIAPLAALDDGTSLADARYAGADLLVGTTAGFDARDLATLNRAAQSDGADQEGNAGDAPGPGLPAGIPLGASLIGRP